jgi:cytosine/adenosine deaminase-related metal-dependent hydrolase
MAELVDLLILDGTVVVMDEAGTIIDGGGVAVAGTRIVAVGASDDLRGRYTARKSIDARRKVIMPGLVDTYGHAGHGLVRGIFHPVYGWPAGDLYWHRTTPDWWYAEARLAATERIRFGVTTGASIVGSTPARLDDPIYAVQNARAYANSGMRVVLGVGPPDPFVSHIPVPWDGSHWENGQWVRRGFTYEEAVANALGVVRDWHGAADGRVRIALHPPYLFGRHAADRGRFAWDYLPEHRAVVLEKAEEMRDLANRHRVQIHTHIFRGSVDFALRHFGRDTVERLLGPDVLVQHANDLQPAEIEVVGATGCNVAAAPSTAENVWCGYAPVVELLEAGANVAIATDGSAPRFSFDLLKEVPRAMWHQWMRFRSQRVLPPGKALRMVTIDAARALNMDHEIGSLEAGKKADIILIDLNKPHLTPHRFIPQILTYYVNGNDVDTTVVDGRVLMEHGRLTSVDVQDVIDQALAEAGRVFDGEDLSAYTEMSADFWHGTRY